MWPVRDSRHPRKIQRSHSVVVITFGSDPNNPSSNPGGTFNFFFYITTSGMSAIHAQYLSVSGITLVILFVLLMLYLIDAWIREMIYTYEITYATNQSQT